MGAGSGDFDLSMVVTADASEAATEGARLEQTLDGVAAAERRTAAAAGEGERSTRAAANARAAFSQVLREGGNMTQAAIAYEAALNRELTQTGGAAQTAAAGVGQLEQQTRRHGAAAQQATGNINRQRAAISQVNYQVQDITMGLATGVSPFVILAQQSGQFFDALQNLLQAQQGNTVAMQNEGRAATNLAGGLANTNRATTTLENKTAQLAAADVAATGTMQTLTQAASRNAGALEVDGIAARVAAGAQLELALVGGEGAAAMGANTGATNANTGAKEANAIAANADAAATARLATAEVGTTGAVVAETGAVNANTGAVVANTGAATGGAVAQTAFGRAAMSVAAFMATGWGAALIAAVSIAGMFAMKMGDAKEAMELAEVGANALSSAQSALGGMFDLTSGKIERQNGLLLVNARLTALNLRAEAMAKRKSAGETFSDVQSGGGGVGGAINRFLSWSSGNAAARRGAVDDVVGKHIRAIRAAKTPEERAKALDRALTETEFREAAERETDVIKNLTGVSGTKWRQAIVDTATAEQNDNVAGAIERSLASGVLDPSLRRDAPKKREKKPRKPRGNSAAERLEEFGEDAEKRIMSLAGGFGDTPAQVEKVRSSLAQLDDLLDDIQRKKPPNFQTLLDQGEAARAVIEDGINKPYREFITSQDEALQVQRLISLGREDEAEALKIILSLEERMGPLSPARKDAILASVQALRAEQQETEKLRESQQKYLSALGEVKDATRAIFDDPLKGIADLPSRLVGAFAQLKADKLFEDMFGDTFRQIEDKITGADVAKDAAERMADAVDDVSAQADRTTAALDALASAAKRAATGVQSGATGNGLDDLTRTVDGLPSDGEAPAGTPPAGATGGAAAVAAGVASSGAAAAADETGGDIVVTGEKRPVQTFSSWIERLARGVGVGKSQTDRDAEIADALKKGVQVGDDAASKIGKFAGKGIEGAATGSMINSFMRPLGKMLGFKTSETGAQIGGAIGSFVPIPFGKEIGAVLGSLAGGLMKTSKTGTATVTNAYDTATTGGNSKAFRQAASGMASTIQDSILNIADALGGQVGSFSVSIGQRDGKYRVDPTGQGKTKTSKGAKDFGEDQGAALAYAVLDAVKDGAVTGLSAAVQEALRSSTDVERALREALQVQQIETLIGGIGSKLNREFSDFDRLAGERVRLAKKYGLDLVALEKINAEERADLVRGILESRVGDLLAFQKDMQFGNLFEGDAPTRRSAILDEIAEVQAEAEAGLEGAAAKLADLYRTLLGTSEEAYGTAGPELSADRSLASEGVARVIQMENERIAKAAGLTQAQLDAIVAGNDLADEANKLAAIGNTKLENIERLLGGGGGGVAAGGGGSGGSVPSYDPGSYGGERASRLTVLDAVDLR